MCQQPTELFSVTMICFPEKNTQFAMAASETWKMIYPETILILMW